MRQHRKHGTLFEHGTHCLSSNFLGEVPECADVLEASRANYYLQIVLHLEQI